MLLSDKSTLDSKCEPASSHIHRYVASVQDGNIIKKTTGFATMLHIAFHLLYYK
jgi:hypothetical protein